MKVGVGICSAVVVSGFLCPAAGVSQQLASTELLDRAKLANELLYADLQNFVCNERIERYRGPINGVDKHRIDTITARVSFENGVEHYSDIHQNERPRSNMSSISGAWSEGEFGTLLQQTQTLLGSQTLLLGTDANLNRSPVVLYRFEVSEEDSPWDLEVEFQHYRIPFRTEVWVSRSSGQIFKIERSSTGIPFETRISKIVWGVTLQPVELNGKTWLLPNTGEYEVDYAESNRREWNVLDFSGYHRYGSEVALSFNAK